MEDGYAGLDDVEEADGDAYFLVTAEWNNPNGNTSERGLIFIGINGFAVAE